MSTLLRTGSLSSQEMKNIDSPVIDAGQKFVIRQFGLADENTGDNKSALAILKFGSESSGFDDIRVLSTTGSTKEIFVNQDFEGDGQKHFRIVLINASSAAKKYGVWIVFNRIR